MSIVRNISGAFALLYVLVPLDVKFFESFQQGNTAFFKDTLYDFAVS